jgi:hypothetical protein
MARSYNPTPESIMYANKICRYLKEYEEYRSGVRMYQSLEVHTMPTLDELQNHIDQMVGHKDIYVTDIHSYFYEETEKNDKL